MKIEKISNSTYRIRKMYKGKTYTVITDYKPTQKEALMLISEKMGDSDIRGKRKSFKVCAKEYLDAKENVISPSTYRAYNSILKIIPDSFANKNIYDIDQLDVQKFINDHSVDHEPKTTVNAYSFITSVLKAYRPNMQFNTALPKKKNKEQYYLSEQDVHTIIKSAAGTKYEIPILLSMYGLRRSEICALTPDDLAGNVITISKAKVQKGNDWIVRNITKTSSSFRKVTISDDLAERIRQCTIIFDGTPNALSEGFRRIAEKNNIPVTLHKMRKFFASYCHAIGIPEADILALGGWSSPAVMKSVYRQSMEKKRKESNEKLNNGFNQIISE